MFDIKSLKSCHKHHFKLTQTLHSHHKPQNLRPHPHLHFSNPPHTGLLHGSRELDIVSLSLGKAHVVMLSRSGGCLCLFCFIIFLSIYYFFLLCFCACFGFISFFSYFFVYFYKYFYHKHHKWPLGENTDTDYKNYNLIHSHTHSSLHHTLL